eukprot:4160788-Amphidinium_carterae.2
MQVLEQMGYVLLRRQGLVREGNVVMRWQAVVVERIALTFLRLKMRAPVSLPHLVDLFSVCRDSGVLALQSGCEWRTMGSRDHPNGAIGLPCALTAHTLVDFLTSVLKPLRFVGSEELPRVLH